MQAQKNNIKQKETRRRFSGHKQNLFHEYALKPAADRTGIFYLLNSTAHNF